MEVIPGYPKCPNNYTISVVLVSLTTAIFYTSIKTDERLSFNFFLAMKVSMM